MIAVRREALGNDAADYQNDGTAEMVACLERWRR